jgi:hypothetical protein
LIGADALSVSGGIDGGTGRSAALVLTTVCALTCAVFVDGETVCVTAVPRASDVEEPGSTVDGFGAAVGSGCVVAVGVAVVG